jgi:hypothetical protein
MEHAIVAIGKYVDRSAAGRNYELWVLGAELKPASAHAAKLRTHNPELRTQNPRPKTQNPEPVDHS